MSEKRAALVTLMTNLVSYADEWDRTDAEEAADLLREAIAALSAQEAMGSCPDQVASLRAERDRLREALTQVADGDTKHAEDDPPCWMYADIPKSGWCDSCVCLFALAPEGKETA